MYAQAMRDFPAGIDTQAESSQARVELQLLVRTFQRGGRASRSARSSGRDESSSCGNGNEAGRKVFVSGWSHPQTSMRGAARGTEIGALEFPVHFHPEQGLGCPSSGVSRWESPVNAPAETNGSSRRVLEREASVSVVTRCEQPAYELAGKNHPQPASKRPATSQPRVCRRRTFDFIWINPADPAGCDRNFAHECSQSSSLAWHGLARKCYIRGITIEVNDL